MNQYEVTERPLTLRTGLVELTEDQANRRRAVLKPTKRKGIYELTGETQFKVGEVIGWDGDVPKAEADNLVDLDSLELEVLPPAEDPEPVEDPE